MVRSECQTIVKTGYLGRSSDNLITSIEVSNVTLISDIVLNSVSCPTPIRSNVLNQVLGFVRGHAVFGYEKANKIRHLQNTVYFSH